MHRSQDSTEPLTDYCAQAFEFVAGTLRGTERANFERECRHNETLQKTVTFWEEQLFGLHETTKTLAPRPDTWPGIEAAIGHPPAQRSAQAPAPRRQASSWNPLRWLPWGLTAALSLVLVYTWSMGSMITISETVVSEPADYVAVLTDTRGSAQLTALTTGESQTMWLKWEAIDIADGRDMQLWAVSRADGQARSIAVLENTGATQLTLSNAYWRLVKDAAYLILTEEEAGGSPLDEPSDVVLAKGVCVRFSGSDTPS